MARLYWTQKQDIGPAPRADHAMAFDRNRGRTVLFGGTDPISRLFNDTREWDGEAWTQVADTGSPARKLHCMAYDSRLGRTVLFGGVDSSGNVIFGDTWEWDGAIWTQVADFGADPCVSAALAFTKDSVALFGGNNPTDPVRVFGNTRDDTWEHFQVGD